MKVDQLATELSPVELLAQDSFSGIAARVKEVFTRTRVYRKQEGKLSYWQLIFSQSKTNGCCYRGEDLAREVAMAEEYMVLGRSE